MITLSPKQRFLKTPAAKVHAELVLDGTFLDALSAAMLQVVYQEVPTADPVLAAASFQRLTGARAFVHALLNLWETEKETKSDLHQNLPHQY